MQLLLVVIGARAGDRQLPCHFIIVEVEFALFESRLSGVDSDELCAVRVRARSRHNCVWIHRLRVVHRL